MDLEIELKILSKNNTGNENKSYLNMSTNASILRKNIENKRLIF